MGLVNRKKSGKISANGRLVVSGQNPITLNPGGKTEINQQKGNTNNGTKQ